MRKYIQSFILAALGAPLAQAGVIDAVRGGVTVHNACITDCDNANKEDGPNLVGEITFVSPQIMRHVGSPKPYVSVSANTAGKTNFVAAGIAWDLRFADKWHFEPGFGYAAHDGELNLPFPQGDQRNTPFTKENVLLGSRDLFRTSFVLGRDIGDQWGVEGLWEHYSHGQILGEGRNQGMDNLGVRVRYRFGN